MRPMRLISFILKSLTDDSVGMSKSDFEIMVAADKDARTITI